MLAFSQKQSKQLCDTRRICGTEDALLYAIRKREFSRVAQPRLFDFKPYPNKEFQYSKHIKDEPQKAKDWTNAKGDAGIRPPVQATPISESRTRGVRSLPFDGECGA